MGWSYNIECSNCDYSKDFFLGVGMMYSPANLSDLSSEDCILPSLIRSNKTLAHIKQLLDEENAVIANGYGHRIYHCPKCREFYQRFYLRLDYKDTYYIVEYKCSKCKAELEPIDYESGEENINLGKYPCPKCGKYSLQKGLGLCIDWD